MYDGPTDQFLAPPSANRSRSRGSSITENIEETAAVWEKAFAGYKMQQLERGNKRRSDSDSRSGRLHAASYVAHSKKDEGHPAGRVSSTIDPTTAPG